MNNHKEVCMEDVRQENSENPLSAVGKSANLFLVWMRFAHICTDNREVYYRCNLVLPITIKNLKN